MGKFLDAIIDVDYWYQAFTCIPNEHCLWIKVKEVQLQTRKIHIVVYLIFLELACNQVIDYIWYAGGLIHDGLTHNIVL